MGKEMDNSSPKKGPGVFIPPVSHPGEAAYATNEHHPNNQQEQAPFSIPEGYEYVCMTQERHPQGPEIEYGPYILRPVAHMAPRVDLGKNTPSPAETSRSGNGVVNFLRFKNIQRPGGNRYAAIGAWVMILTVFLSGFQFMPPILAALWSFAAVYVLNPIGGRSKREKIKLMIIFGIAFIFLWFGSAML